MCIEDEDFWQHLEDAYDVIDVLNTLCMTPSELYRDYLYELIEEHRDDFVNV